MSAPGGTDAPSVAEAQRLAALSAYQVIEAPPDDPVHADLAALCELAATVCGVSTSVVNLIDDRFQHQVAAYGIDPAPCRLDESMCQTTLAAGSDICLEDAASDARFSGSPWVDGRLGKIRFYCSAILRTPAGHAIGTLCVFDETARVISGQQLRSLQLLARQVVDVLELRLHARLLEDSHAELGRSQDRLAAFAGQISHDLKAPITAILGFTELLGDREVLTADATAVSYLARCTSAARRMLAMIDSMLAFARVGGTLNLAPVALDAVVPDVLSDLSADSGAAQVTWAGPEIVADEAQLRSLLANLIRNALLYSTDGQRTVEVCTERVGDEVVLRVIDHGAGVAPERREEITRPLVRLRTDVPGAGLGLAICARIMDSHGGTLRIEDTPGGGTTVVAAFPAR